MSFRRLLSGFALVWCVVFSVFALSGSVAMAKLGNPLLNTFGSFGNVQSIAVDNGSGDVYVYDMGQGGGSLFKFDAEGNPVSFTGLAGEPTVIEGLGAAFGYSAEIEIAVDNSVQATKGDIYVASNNGSVKIIGSDGKELGSIGAEAPAPWGEACGVAVDPSGNVYVGIYGGYVNKYANNSSGVTSKDYVSSITGLTHTCNIAVDSAGSVFTDQDENGPVTRYEASAFGPLPASGKIVDAGGSTLAVDSGNGEVYVDERGRVAQFGPHGEPFEIPVNTLGTGAIENSIGIALNGATHDIYISDGKGHVLRYGPLGPEPALVDAESVTTVGYTEATLTASINPQEVATSYHFEYGLDAHYGVSVPVSDFAIGSGGSDVKVSQLITGLRAGTTYHYRVVATTAEGAVTPGQDKTLTTYPAPVAAADSCPNAELRSVQSAESLPDCRAYELVSPPGAGKSGSDVSAFPTRTQSSLDGNAIAFITKTSYGQVAGSDTDGGTYVARRSGGEWSSYSINPPQGSSAFSLFASAGYQAFSPDLSKGVFYGLTPVVAGHTNVEHVGNLYLRQNVLTSTIGSYELLSDAVAPVSPWPETIKQHDEVKFGAASADWSHIVFETNHNLTPETAGLNPRRPKAYEWHNGTVKLVGMLSGGVPLEGSVVGRGIGAFGENAYGNPYVYESWATHTISADGSRVIFTGWPLTTNDPHPNVHEPTMGKLYMRIDGRETIQLNASERKEPDAPQPAMFAAATADDSRVFFMTDEALTDATPTTGGRKIYMYDINAPEGHRLTLIGEDEGIAGIEAEMIVGLTDDGSYVYFTSSKELLPGLPRLNKLVADHRRLYLWHNGVLSYVVSHQEENDEYAGTAWGTNNLDGGDTFRVSSDGKTIAFASSDPGTALRTGYDNRPGVGATCNAGEKGGRFGKRCLELYTYNTDTGRLICASCNRSGTAAMSDVNTGEFADAYEIGAVISQYLNNFMSSDGRYVFFDTSEALVAEDVNGHVDVYEYDTSTEQVHLISSGTCGCDSHFVDASPDGSNVFFTTRQRLVHVDTDTSSDLYDARIGGGIPGQNRPPAVPCSGEECQGPTVSPPVISLPSSSTFSGIGNPLRPATVKVAAKKHKPVKRKRKHKGKGRKGARRSNRHARG